MACNRLILITPGLTVEGRAGPLPVVPPFPAGAGRAGGSGGRPPPRAGGWLEGAEAGTEAAGLAWATGAGEAGRGGSGAGAGLATTGSNGNSTGLAVTTGTGSATAAGTGTSAAGGGGTGAGASTCRAAFFFRTGRVAGPGGSTPEAASGDTWESGFASASADRAAGFFFEMRAIRQTWKTKRQFKQSASVLGPALQAHHAMSKTPGEQNSKFGEDRERFRAIYCGKGSSCGEFNMRFAHRPRGVKSASYPGKG